MAEQVFENVWCTESRRQRKHFLTERKWAVVPRASEMQRLSILLEIGIMKKCCLLLVLLILLASRLIDVELGRSLCTVPRRLPGVSSRTPDRTAS